MPMTTKSSMRVKPCSDFLILFFVLTVINFMLFIFGIYKVNQDYEGVSRGYFERRIMGVKTFGTKAGAFVFVQLDY